MAGFSPWLSTRLAAAATGTLLLTSGRRAVGRDAI
jgi:hypothetical protein